MPSSHPLYPKLSPLLQAYQSDFQLRAQVWQRKGAQRFGLYLNDKPLLEWSWKTRAKVITTRQAPIFFEGEICAEVRVEGHARRLSQADLEAEATLIGRLLQAEHTTRVKTQSLTEMQDRLLGLYELVRATRLMHNTVGDVISEMTRAAIDVLKANGTFLYIDLSRSISAVNQYPGFSESQGREYLLQVQQTRQPKRVVCLPTRTTGEEVLLLPIRISGTIQGVLGFVDQPARFTPIYEKLAEIVAEQTGARIEHVMLYDNILHQQRLTTEMELARQVQMHLLPQKQPSISGLDICGMTFPALQVGGDFYEFIVNDQAFTFIVGDVSGKGLSAAMMMAMTRAILRSTASFAFALMTPEDILTQTNEDVHDDYTRVVTFTTVFVGQYELDASRRDRLTIANAGHSPVVYCPVGEYPRLLEADAPPLGVLNTIEAPNHSIRLKDGDVIIVATDGFSEAENSQNEIFGYDRLLELADQTRHLPARDIVKTFSEAAVVFEKDRAQHDDRTIVVIKRLGPPDEDSSHATS
jgi:phosphoserine phosphatase RsbU/P